MTSKANKPMKNPGATKRARMKLFKANANAKTEQIPLGNTITRKHTTTQDHFIVQCLMFNKYETRWCAQGKGRFDSEADARAWVCEHRAEYAPGTVCDAGAYHYEYFGLRIVRVQSVVTSTETATCVALDEI